MRRRLSHEKIDRLRKDALAKFNMLGRRIARWADDNGSALTAATPEIPPGFHNRVRANWKLLLAIAENAGNEWKRAAWQAAG